MLRPDVWLGERLGKPAFQVGRDIAADALPSAPAFVGAKLDVADTDGLLRLQTLGFQVIDTNVQLRRAATDAPAETGPARFTVDSDEAGIRKIAGESFVYDRFHRDPKIDSGVAARIKADWAGNFFAGKRGEWMVTSGAPGKPEGFLQLMKGENGTIVIDLIAVSAAHRGKGLAQAMIGFAAQACLGHAAPLNVGTQIANLPSLSLYERLGFRIISAGYVLHLHR